MTKWKEGILLSVLLWFRYRSFYTQVCILSYLCLNTCGKIKNM